MRYDLCNFDIGSIDALDSEPMGSEVRKEEAEAFLRQAVRVDAHCSPEGPGKAKACALPFHQTALTRKCPQLGCAQFLPDLTWSIFPLLS